MHLEWCFVYRNPKKKRKVDTYEKGWSAMRINDVVKMRSVISSGKCSIRNACLAEELRLFSYWAFMRLAKSKLYLTPLHGKKDSGQSANDRRTKRKRHWISLKHTCVISCRELPIIRSANGFEQMACKTAESMHYMQFCESMCRRWASKQISERKTGRLGEKKGGAEQ